MTIDQNEVILTKAMLLEGKSLVHKLKTEMGTFELRPLGIDEQNHADELKLAGLKAKGTPQQIEDGESELDFKADQFTKNQNAYTLYIVSCGMSIDKGLPVTVKDVGNFKIKPLVLAAVLKEIEDISGMTEATEEKIRLFRENKGGNAADEPDNDGDTAGENDGGIDSVPATVS